MAQEDKKPDLHGAGEEALDAKVSGVVKWFDPLKGFGFVLADGSGSDVLLHVNVLRNFGQSSIADGTRVELVVQERRRGLQAIQVLAIAPPDSGPDDPSMAIDEFDLGLALDAPIEPARVKWFDKAKGFGFANVFGKPEDVFLHIEVLRQSGLSDLQPGEALAIQVMDGERGKMVARVQAWETVKSDQSSD